jgi:Rod binding domain-containing protein
MTGIEASRAVQAGDALQVNQDRARLQSAVRQLQGVFVEQLLKAMRATVPDDGVVNGGSGEEIFSGLLDSTLASLVPESFGRNSLEDALTRQLRAAMAPDAIVTATGRNPGQTGAP